VGVGWFGGWGAAFGLGLVQGAGGAGCEGGVWWGGVGGGGGKRGRTKRW